VNPPQGNPLEVIPPAGSSLANLLGANPPQDNPPATNPPVGNDTPPSSTSGDSDDTSEDTSDDDSDDDQVHLGANMSPAQWTSFQNAWSLYKDQQKEYSAQMDAIDKVKDWVRKTVSRHYQKTSCLPTATLRSWYRRLKENVGTTNRQTKAQAREAYKKAVKPLASVPKDFPAWITAWEQAIAAGQEKKVAATLQCSDWFEDFTDAVSPVMESWVLAYSITKSQEIDDDTLSYRQVANDFRKAVRSKRPGKRSPFAKGSFGSTFGGQEDEAADQSGSEKKAKGQKKRKRSREEDGGNQSSRPSCKACGQFHPFPKCFYAFPHKAPDTWHENPAVRKTYEANLQADPALAEQIKRMRKEKETGQSEKNND
jgi:hypothetical protein